jgi:hypothetical protein
MGGGKDELLSEYTTQEDIVDEYKIYLKVLTATNTILH